MRYRHFEALAPLCPRCLHQRGLRAPLKVAAREQERAGELWHGWLVCTNSACQLEFPVLDGVPLIVADPAAMLASLGWQALRRDDLPEGVESLIGDALGPGSEFDTTRQHLSLYGLSHYGDWACAGPSAEAAGTGRPGRDGERDAGERATASREAGLHGGGPQATGSHETGPRDAGPQEAGPRGTGSPRAGLREAGRQESGPQGAGAPQAARGQAEPHAGGGRGPASGPASKPPGAIATAAALADWPGALEGLPEGPVLDLGSGPGRTGWELACRTGRMVLGVDLSLTFLRLAQHLRLEGEASVPRRRLGLVYDRLRLQVPASHAGAEIDFWALDAQALPFAPASAALLALVNVLDCVPAPAALLAEAARIARPGALALLTTPFDWSPAATRPEHWLGGHSQRGPLRGASEPALEAAARQAGWQPEAQLDGPDWPLRLHDRSEMTYRLHLSLLCRA